MQKRIVVSKVLSRVGVLRGLDYLRRLRPDKNQLVILAYHRIADWNGNDSVGIAPYDPELISASVAQFEEQVDYVHRHYDVITFKELDRRLRSNRSSFGPALIITFDDGYRDNYTNAYPILKRYRCPATIFVTTQHVGNQHPFWFERVAYLIKTTRAERIELPMIDRALILSLHSRDDREAALEKLLVFLKAVPDQTRLTAMQFWEENCGNKTTEDAVFSQTISWDEIRTMHRGGIEFGAHTVSHPVLAQITPDRLSYELEESKQVIERELGEEVISFAYPFGSPHSYNERVKDQVRQKGFLFAVASFDGINDLRAIDRHELQRVRMEHEMKPDLFRSVLLLPSLFSRNNGRSHPPGTTGAEDEFDLERIAALAQTRGWKAGIEKSSEEYDSKQASEFRSRLMYQSTGWIGLLDPLRRQEVLVVDPGLGTAPVVLSRFYKRVYLWTEDEAIWSCQERRIEWLGIKNIERLEGKLPLPMADHSCDAAVLYLSPSSKYSEHVSLKEIKRILRSSGSCYIGFENRYAHRYVRASMRGKRVPDRSGHHSPQAIRRKLRPFFQTTRFYPLQQGLYDLREILPPDRNDALWETPYSSLKSLLKGYLQNHVAPAYGVVSSNGTQNSSLVGIVLGNVASRLGKTRPLTLRRFLIGKPNGLLFVAGEAGRRQELVIRVPLDDLTLERCRRNYEALQDLVHLESLRGKTPQPLLSGEVAGFHFFVESFLSGVVGDKPSATAVQQAAALLTQFHSETAHRTVVDENHLRELVRDPFKQALPWISEKDRCHFLELEEKITAFLRGESIPLVHSHGDFTIENILFHGETGRLTGVIDWDYSRKSAFPLLDLLYYLHHDESRQCKWTLAEIISERLTPAGYTSFERELISIYCHKVGLSERFLQVFTILSWVYHLAYRLQYTENYQHAFVIRWATGRLLPEIKQKWIEPPDRLRLSDYECRKCGFPLQRGEEFYECIACRKRWEIANGVPCFDKPEFYWGEIPQEMAWELNKAARQKGWQTGLQEIVRGPFPNIYNYIVDERRAEMRFLLPISKESSVLDVGAGWGSIAINLAPLCRRVVAAEWIRERAEFIKIRAEQEGLGNVEVIQANTLKLPPSSNSFDCIIVNGVLEWVGLSDLTQSPGRVQCDFLTEMRRLLKPGGTLYIGIENRFGYSLFLGGGDHSGLSYTSLMPRWLADIVCKYAGRTYRIDKPLHAGYRTYTYSRIGYTNLLKQSGFDSISFYAPYPSYNLPVQFVSLQGTFPALFYFRNVASYSPTIKGTLKQWLLLAAARLGLVGWFNEDYSIVAKANKLLENFEGTSK